MIKTRFEFMLTLECHWGCKDCCRGLEESHPADSHVTIDQASRFIQHMKNKDVFVKRLKVNGGDPVHNPDFESIIKLFAAEVPGLFGKVKVQTAYPSRYIAANYKLPSMVQLRSEPVDGKNYKSHHVPWFVSPSECGLLENDIPPLGSTATQRACPLQSRCGRSFERWGFIGCAQEGVIGRMLGIQVHEKEYKHWANSDICKHCPMCLGQKQANAFQKRAKDGEFPFVSKCFDVTNLTTVYDEMPLTHKAW